MYFEILTIGCKMITCHTNKRDLGCSNSLKIGEQHHKSKLKKLHHTPTKKGETERNEINNPNGNRNIKKKTYISLFLEIMYNSYQVRGYTGNHVKLYTYICVYLFFTKVTQQPSVYHLYSFLKEKGKGK